MIPPPPDPKDGHAWKQWWGTTFPVGSRAKMVGGALFIHESDPQRQEIWDYDCSAGPAGCLLYPSGVVTIGDDGPNGTEIYFVVPYGPNAGRWSRWVSPDQRAGREQIAHMLKPIDDHWPAPAPLRPRQLPPSQRGLSMKHRRLKPNVIPAPPPDTTSRHFLTWVERTFPPGSNFRFGGLLCQVDMITSDAGPQRRAFNGRLTYGVVPGLRDRFGGLVPSADALVGPGMMHLSFAEVQGGYLTGALRPVVDHWATLQGAPLLAKHRRLAPNTIPTPPMSAYPAAGSSLLAPAAYGQWVERTYRAGTRVSFPNGIVTLLGPLPPGARGVVDRVQTEPVASWRSSQRAKGAPEYQFVYVRVTDARDRSGLPLSQFTNYVMQIDSLYYYAAGENMTHAVVPLDDNWDSTSPSSKRTSLPTSQRGRSMKHRRLAPNVVPSVPSPTGVGATTQQIAAWAAVTYAPGTPVMFLKAAVSGAGYLTTEDTELPVPVGSRGETVDVRTVGSFPAIAVKIVDARDEHGYQRRWAVGKTVFVSVFSAHAALEPMVDNWVALQRRKRTSYKGKNTAPNKRTSRKKGRIRP